MEKNVLLSEGCWFFHETRLDPRRAGLSFPPMLDVWRLTPSDKEQLAERCSHSSGRNEKKTTGNSLLNMCRVKMFMFEAISNHSN